MKKLVLLLTLAAVVLSACGAKAGDTRKAKGDNMPQVYVSAGTFRMGGLDADKQPDEQPDHKVSLNAFWMDKTEVTNAMYLRCVNDGVCEPPRDFTSATQKSYFNNPQFDNYPVINVTWEDAKAYCQWVGRRLPTEAEWEYAARGTTLFRFPWGDADATPSLANYDYQLRDTAAVGSYPDGASPFGVLDLGGNVWEYTADYYLQTYYRNSPESNPTGPEKPGPNGQQRVVRGGSWADNAKEMRVANRGFILAPDLSADKLSQSYLGEANNRTGFRCVSDK